jgi:hypothetical protein
VGLVKLAIRSKLFELFTGSDLTPPHQSIAPVSLFQFFIATWFVLPKAVIYVFVGSRIAKLSDGKQRNHMDTRKNTCRGIPLSLIHGAKKQKSSTAF